MTSRAVGIQTAYDYMNKNQAAATWDNSVGQNYVEFETSDGTVQIWLEDEQSLEAKVNVMKEHNLGGIAAWSWALMMDAKYLGRYQWICGRVNRKIE